MFSDSSTPEREPREEEDHGPHVQPQLRPTVVRQHHSLPGYGEEDSW